MFILITGDADRIALQRAIDRDRTRPVLNIAQIDEHQAFVIKVTQNCAKSLNIPYFVVETGDFGALKEAISGFLS